MVNIKFTKLAADVKTPEYATPHASGMDVFAIEDVPVTPGSITMAKTGLKVEIPEGWEIQVRPKSGLALKGLTVVNSPGTVDCDYRGEIGVILGNLSSEPIVLEKGKKIAQLVVCPVEQGKYVDIEVTEELSETDRGEGGFGSTGE